VQNLAIRAFQESWANSPIRQSEAFLVLFALLAHERRSLPMSHAFTPIVFVVDADASTRESLELLIRTVGWQAVTFASTQDFLAYPRSAVPSCLIVDAALPDLGALALQRQIASERLPMPVIFLSGYCDIETTVKAMKGGALDFLIKPINRESLLSAITEAIKRSEAVLGRESELHQLRSGYGSLTPREREVMALVVSGLPNKLVGGELGISEITVKMHRGNVMRKMNAGSFAHLVNMASRLRVVRSLRPITASA
jgi:FixJ family two-component response regulator